MIVDSSGQERLPPFNINGVRYPDNIALLWSDAQLAAIGLSRVPAPVIVGPPVEPVISRRQFAHALKRLGEITQQEAMAFVKTGDLPAALAAAVAALPTQDAREDANLLLSGATEFRRNHQLVAVFATTQGWTNAQVDDLFAAAAQL